MKWLVMLWALATTAVHASDEVFKRGPYEVRVTPFPSTFLTPEIASRYGFARSETQALLNLSVYDTRLEGAVKTIAATISGSHQNLIGQAFELSFQTIDEGVAIYYLAPFRISDDEVMRFDLEIIPEGTNTAIDVTFNQRFYRQ
ncbi:MAG: DUF4426 domain-containing protein [Litorivicinus sp.]